MTWLETHQQRLALALIGAGFLLSAITEALR